MANRMKREGATFEDREERLLLMSILPVLGLTMTEYGYLANLTIENGV